LRIIMAVAAGVGSGGPLVRAGFDHGVGDRGDP
jgi:hypothetical protein